MPRQHKELLQEFEGFATSANTAQALMQHISDRVHQETSRYNWVGFYLMTRDEPPVLLLGPFAGSFTPVSRISLERGLCGASASTGKPVLVDDVTRDPRYLQATDMVKSELVAPVLVRGRVAGIIDCESYFVSTFSPPQEQEFVTACAAVVGRYLERAGANP